MNKVGLRLAFAGTPELAATVLNDLLRQDTHSVSFVITRPDKPAGRGRKLVQSPVRLMAEQHGLSVLQPQNPSDLDPDKALVQLDVLVVVAYGMILPQDILDRPRLGCINVHTSLLPRWRGAAPIQRAIQAGDSKTGVTIMQLAAGLDTGDILLQQECVISPRETAGTLHDKLANLGGSCLLEALERLERQTITPRKQDQHLVTYANKISKREASINWELTAMELERLIRAFNPAPVTHTNIQGVAMRVWEADILPQSIHDLTPGTVIEVNVNGIIVATGQGMLRIKRLQLPGKKVITAREFLNGHPDVLRPGQQ